MIADYLLCIQLKAFWICNWIRAVNIWCQPKMGGPDPPPPLLNSHGLIKKSQKQGCPSSNSLNVKYDAPREVCGNRKWFYRPLKKWGLKLIMMSIVAGPLHSVCLTPTPGMYCIVCLLIFKSGFMAWGSRFRFQGEGQVKLVFTLLYYIHKQKEYRKLY